MKLSSSHKFIVRSFLIVVSLVLTVGLFYVFTGKSSASSSTPEPTSPLVAQASAVNEDSADYPASSPRQKHKVSEPNVLQPAASKIPWPISRATERITKKEFGQLIEPGHSPVPNDRFKGYHVGVDFEILPGEEDEAVLVYAICDGPLVLKKMATGYGGVAVQACWFNGQDVTVIYGHLNLESITAQPKESLTAGQAIGRLGAGYSEETDGVRKHLHLGIHRGADLDIRGYVQDATEIDQWLDPLTFMSF